MKHQSRLHGSRYQEIWEGIGDIIRPSSSVLDLGGACGTNARRALKLSGGTGRVAVVELVPGWVTEGKKSLKNVEFYNADASNFTLTEAGLDQQGVPSTFDVMYMADSFEHIPSFRKAALWETIKKHSKVGTRLFIHIPTPKKQAKELAGQRGGDGQYFEEIIQYERTEQQGRCLAGMQLDKVIDHQSGFASLWFTRTI